MTTPFDDARDNLHRANVSYLCNPADVADLVARHDALRRETEALRAELNRTAKTLIAGQVALQAERDAARCWARVWKRQARDNWRDARMAHRLFKEASE